MKNTSWRNKSWLIYDIIRLQVIISYLKKGFDLDKSSRAANILAVKHTKSFCQIAVNLENKSFTGMSEAEAQNIDDDNNTSFAFKLHWKIKEAELDKHINSESIRPLDRVKIDLGYYPDLCILKLSDLAAESRLELNRILAIMKEKAEGKKIEGVMLESSSITFKIEPTVFFKDLKASDIFPVEEKVSIHFQKANTILIRDDKKEKRNSIEAKLDLEINEGNGSLSMHLESYASTGADAIEELDNAFNKLINNLLTDVITRARC